jgi:hypothetical protein
MSQPQTLVGVICNGMFRPDRHGALLLDEELPAEPPADVSESGRAAWQKLHQLQKRYLAVGVSDPAGFSTAVRAFTRETHGGSRGHPCGLTTDQLFYAGGCARISYVRRIAERSGLVADQIRRDLGRWDREHGFDYRCQMGIPHLIDRDRLAAGDEPRPDAPAPPHLELLA